MGKARKKVIKKKNIRSYYINQNDTSRSELKKIIDEAVDEYLKSGLKINNLGKSRKKL